MNEVERRFKPIDEYLKKYLKEYNKISKRTQDTLQNVFNELDVEYSDLNKIAPQYKKERLDRRLSEILKIKDESYLYYKLNQTLHKKKISYRELLESYILSAYYQERKELDEYDNKFFFKVLKTSYKQGIDDIKRIKTKKIDDIFDWSIFYSIMNIPLLYGTKEDYLNALAMTNADEMFKKSLNNLQGNKALNINSLDMQELLKKQRNRVLSINGDKSSGAIENMVESYSNLAYLQSGIDNDVRKCRFIAEIDERTTKMCQSLNEQIFYVDKMNVYQRYSDIDKRIVTYNTKGLVLGENLPPIMNHFHYCRSTITYLIDKDGFYDSDTRFKEREKSKLKSLKVIDEIVFDNGFIDKNGIFHPIKGKEKIDIPNENSNEFKFAVLFKKKYGGDLHMVPRINTDVGNSESAQVSTPDYIWNNEKWDLKSMTNVSSKTRALDNAISSYEEQSHNFFIDISNCKIEYETIIEQAKNVFRENKLKRDWVEKIYLIKDGEIVNKFTK